MKRTQPQQLYRIGFLLFDGVNALDVVGPLEAFSTARVARADSGLDPIYELVTIGAGRRSVITESGLTLKPRIALSDCPRLDTLMIPGGGGLRKDRANAQVTRWIKQRAASTRRIAAVCTGAFGLAPTGLLDGRCVTTHWRFASQLARSFPLLRVQADAIFVKDGKFYTSAGITAGIDLSLALIEEDLGHAAALQVARELVVYMKRMGGQEQYSEPLRYQAATTDRIGDVTAFIDAHLTSRLSVEALAVRNHLSPRQFSRRFQAAFNISPAAYVRNARLDRARQLLCAGHGNLLRLAHAVGFASDDAFRRAFEQRFGISPSDYRGRFSDRDAAPTSRTIGDKQ